MFWYVKVHNYPEEHFHHTFESMPTGDTSFINMRDSFGQINMMFV